MISGLAEDIAALASGARARTRPDVVGPGQILMVGQSATSPSGQYAYSVEEHGAMLEQGRGTPGVRVLFGGRDNNLSLFLGAMQSDGNFVVYSRTQAIWATGTQGNPGAILQVLDSGELAVFSASGAILWTHAPSSRASAILASKAAADAQFNSRAAADKAAADAAAKAAADVAAKAAADKAAADAATKAAADKAAYDAAVAKAAAEARARAAAPASSAKDDPTMPAGDGGMYAMPGDLYESYPDDSPTPAPSSSASSSPASKARAPSAAAAAAAPKKKLLTAENVTIAAGLIGVVASIVKMVRQ